MVKVLQFKQCTSSDLKLLTEISRSTFVEAFEKDNDPDDFKSYLDKAFTAEVIQQELNTKGAYFYLVYDGNSLVGYFRLNESGAQSDINDPDSIELERIYVLSEQQNKGYGQLIMKEVIMISHNFGKRYIWLGVWERNAGAIRFYESLGFTKFGEHPYIIGTDVQTDWLMKLDLK